MRAAVAVYSMLCGILIAAMWSGHLLRGAWSRPDRSHAELGLHLAGELTTAAWLIAAGATILVAGQNAVPYLAVALGMLLYTVIVSSGYFASRRELPAVGMFAALVVLTGLALGILLSGA